MAMYATGLWSEMDEAVQRAKHRRRVEDPASPMGAEVLEAEPGRSFELQDPTSNVPVQRPLNMDWAAANVLHFFGGSEEAGALREYNPNAGRFLTGDRWVGAYGVAARPQVDRCVELLRRCPSTRRAVVSMPGLSEMQDANQPPCWSTMHFLHYDGCLDLLVYQRSLNLVGVMPYDCILFCNALLYVAEETGLGVGVLRWTVGSLHIPVGAAFPAGRGDPKHGLHLPASVLRDPAACRACLEDRKLWTW